MLVNKVEKNIKTTLDAVIRYQVITHCFFKGIQVTNSDIELIAELAKKVESDMSSFCEFLTEVEVFKSTQSARNSITKAIKKGLIVRKEKKKIGVNPELAIQHEDAVFLNYKILGLPDEA